MSRHTITDLSSALRCPPEKSGSGRLPPGELLRLRSMISQKGLRLADEDEMGKRLAELRPLYEPYVSSLALRFHLAVPPWVRE